MRPADSFDDKRGICVRRWRNVALVLCGLCVATLAAGATPQRSFPSADEAAAALVKAVKARDRSGILAILGPGAEKSIWSGDAVADRAAGEHFVAAYEQKHATSSDGDTRATLTIGPDDWPFAFPLVRSAKGWRFDTEAGKTELVARRIGENELAAMNVMLAIVDAQRDYVSEDRDKSGVREYARKFVSTAGRKDGLYWPTKTGQPESPLGTLVARATAEGYPKDSGPRPYHGYYFRMLKGQGSNAKGGALDYVVRDRMIGGFAAIAYPARYGNSGVMTFLVNHDGDVYEKDLGPGTAKLAPAITRFDPGAGWTRASVK
jgi:Protein of unknown function (DUF2950)